ncbi:MAG TPA: CocE/NonD family hydrolase [Gemmatimonadales bacterium]|nr:CocE/NonD family hydrolase [Gemmatimonadales bacterium]
MLPLLAGLLLAQQLDFPAAVRNDTAALRRYLPRLAAEVLAGYREPDRRVYLGNRFRLETVAGRYAAAQQTLAAFGKALGRSTSQETGAANFLYGVYASALRQAPAGALQRELAHALAGLDNLRSAMAIRALAVSPAALQGALNGALPRPGERGSIALGDALRLVKAWHAREALRALAAVAAPVIAADDRRRYLIETNLRVATPDGGTVCTMVVRPRRARGRLPTLLNFTIYADTLAKLVDSRRAAANGYVGVVGFSRGKLCSPDPVEPYEHDGADAAALIDWIARQPWSDGRVGMYGGSYEGFTQWAAAKHLPAALKTIIPSVPVGPGLDVPMEGNIFVNFVYPWPFFTANLKTLDSATYYNPPRWNRLNREWYVSGRAYRELDRIDGTPNPIFDRWIAHPSYDAYWRGMIPFGDEFARIGIPVLQTMGYFFGGPGAAEYYFREHYRHNPLAQHYLVAGPYDHVPGQRGVVTALGDTVYDFAGYTLDQVALQDLWHLRFQWFDWIFKGAPKPPLLADKLNYQVMGANLWRHAPSIPAMANGALRLYLGAERASLPGVGANAYRLERGAPPADRRITQTVNLADRSDIDRILAGGGILSSEIDTVDVLQFVSEPLEQATELSGLFSGSLDLAVNKRDFDAYIALYQQTAQGQYFLLTTWQMRASYLNDLAHRKLLTPGQRQRLDFTSIRLTSRLLARGSRIVALVGPIKAPVLQLNLGSGKDVSDETLADAGPPLTIEWFADSYLQLPIRTAPAKARPGAASH